jgi:hypothetical protein
MNFLELYVVLIVLRCWGHLMAGRCFAFSIDNSSSVDALISSKSSSPRRQQILREIAVITSKFDINIRPKHLSSTENILADLLSRIKQNPDNVAKFLDLTSSMGYPHLVFQFVPLSTFEFTNGL